MKTSSFNAPWDTGVKLITMLASAVLGYYIFSSLQHHTHVSEADFFLRVVLPLSLLGLGLAFMVTGYSVDSEGIVIRRLLWRRRIRRADIATIAPPSRIGGRTIGVCGIWGFCGTSGIAYTGTLGFHFVAASAYDNRLVISRRSGLPVVISPSDSEAFVRAFNETNAA